MFPRDIICLRNISINTLHKEEEDDDHDDDDSDDDDNYDDNNNNNNNDDDDNNNNNNVPRDIVCLRNMSINTLHKGDDDDDDNNNNNNIESLQSTPIIILHDIK